MQELVVSLHHKDARLPTWATEGSIGYDLKMPCPIEMPPWSRRTIDTKVKVQIPHGHYVRIAPKSSLTICGLDVVAGVIDPDYKGTLRVVLSNNSVMFHTLQQHMAIAQFILEKVSLLPLTVKPITPLPIRGTGGFGSTTPENSVIQPEIGPLEQIPILGVAPSTEPPTPWAIMPTKENLPAQFHPKKKHNRKTETVRYSLLTKRSQTPAWLLPPTETVFPSMVTPALMPDPQQSYAPLNIAEEPVYSPQATSPFTPSVDIAFNNGELL